jgi:hypothetical protein
MRTLLPTLVYALLAAADVDFTAPAAGESVAAGTIEVQWKESGAAPSISELTGYTLSLLTGGNDNDNMLPLTTFVSQGTFDHGYSAQGTIPDGIAAAVDNGL